jgi:hypothetical protein
MSETPRTSGVLVNPQTKENTMAAINNRDLNFILTTVIEGGSAYWANDSDVCQTVEIKREADSDEDLRSLKLVSEIKITTDVDGKGWKTQTITATEMRKALKAMKEDQKLPEHLRKMARKLLNNGDEDYDAGDADVIFQYALFGEIVFG